MVLGRVPELRIRQTLIVWEVMKQVVPGTRLKQELIAMQKRRGLVQTTPTRERLAVMLRQRVFALRVPANVTRLMFGTTLTGRCNKFAGDSFGMSKRPPRGFIPWGLFFVKTKYIPELVSGSSTLVVFNGVRGRS